MQFNRLFSTLALTGCAIAPAIAQTDTRLFVDEQGFASYLNTTRTIQQPTKVDAPLITGDRPWQLNPYTFGSVIYDEQDSIFKAWYQSYNYGLPVGIRTPVLYATSTDGRNWSYPNVGNVSYEGSTDNNILFLGQGKSDLYSPSVIKDINDPNPNQRYKMVYWDATDADIYKDPDNGVGGGMFTAVSPDGINWTRSNGPILPARKAENAISDVMDIMRDPETGNYVVHTKGWADPWPSHRQIVRTESADFISWSEPEVVVRHDTDPQSYGMPVFEHEGMYFGLMRSYHSPGDNTINIQLMVSPDNRSWDYVDREQVFIPVGEDGAWDDGMIFTAPPIVHDEEILIYYGGWNGPHNTNDRDAAIGLATLPIGRLVALQAHGQRGEVTTTAFTFDGSDILLNANATDGEVRVEVLDASGQVIEGFGMDDFLSIDSDVSSGKLLWNSNDLQSLVGQDIQLRFEVTGDAKLFSYTISEGVIPEPSSLALIAIGGLLLSRRSR